MTPLTGTAHGCRFPAFLQTAEGALGSQGTSISQLQTGKADDAAVVKLADFTTQVESKPFNSR